MFNNNAYLHQYYKYGLEKDKFLECFSTMENIVANYNKLWLVKQTITQRTYLLFDTW